MSLFRLLYRAALMAVPARLRRKHGRTMEDAAEREVSRAFRREGSGAGVVAVWQALRDAVGGGIAERWRGRGAVVGRDRFGAGIRASGGERGWNMRDVVTQDVRFAVRGLVKAPMLAVLAVATLGLGIGANTALFSVVNGVVLRPLPFPDAAQVTHLAWQRGGALRGWVPAYKFDFWRRSTGAFEAMTTWRQVSVRLEGDGPLESLGALRVSPGFFDVVGQAPVLGRGLTASDDLEGSEDVVVVSQAVWQDRFAGSRDVLDRTLVLEGRPHRIVGVLPAGFSFPQAAHSLNAITPLRLRPDPTDERENYPILARLRGGVSPEQADAEVRSLTSSYRSEHPDLVHETDQTMRLASFQDIYVGALGDKLWILMGATALVLLIACANVANLLLARTMDRREELDLRKALGASKARIVVQLSVESVILTGLAAATGLILAHWGVGLLLALAPAELPRAAEVGIDWAVLSLTLAVTAVTAGAFGVASASLVSDRGSGGLSRRAVTRPAWRSRTRQALIAGEAAFALVLLVGAGLLAGTLLRLTRVDAGFTTEGLMTAHFSLRPDRYQTTDELLALERELLDRLTSDPAVTAVALTSSVPLERGVNMPMALASDPDVFVGDVEWRSVSPGFFETMGIPVLRGRSFGPGDLSEAPQVVVVNESFAAQYFPDTDPLGQRILIGHYNGRWIAPEFASSGAVIVGIAADISEMSLKSAAKRTMWVPRSQTQSMLLGMPVVLAGGSDPGTVGARIRQTVQAVDPALPVPELRTMSEVVGGSVAEERFNATLMGLFAALALVLTAFGIYGAVAYGVRQRTREVGIRIALGARRAGVVRMMALQGIAPVVVGLTFGAGASLYLSRFLSDLVWGMSATDPATIVGVALVLAFVAGAAAYLPAQSAARSDPREALTAE